MATRQTLQQTSPNYHWPRCHPTSVQDATTLWICLALQGCPRHAGATLNPPQSYLDGVVQSVGGGDPNRPERARKTSTDCRGLEPASAAHDLNIAPPCLAAPLACSNIRLQPSAETRRVLSCVREQQQRILRDPQSMSTGAIILA
jgi:hypothetical protein